MSSLVEDLGLWFWVYGFGFGFFFWSGIPGMLGGWDPGRCRALGVWGFRGLGVEGLGFKRLGV